MKSLFLLSGGFSGTNSLQGIRYYRMMAEYLRKDKLRALNIGFGSPQNPKYKNWEGSAYYLGAALEYINPHIEFEVDVARPFPKKSLIKQISDADIIYANGGDGDLLQETLGHIHRELPELVLNDKVLAGASAGCNMWADSYYSNDNRRVTIGMGVIPIKTFCHYNSYKWKQLREICLHKPELPTVPLGDMDFIAYCVGDELLPIPVEE